MIKDHSAGGQKFSVTSLMQLADSLKLLTFLSLAESSMRKTFKLYNIHNFVIDQASRQEMKWEGDVFFVKSAQRNQRTPTAYGPVDIHGGDDFSSVL